MHKQISSRSIGLGLRAPHYRAILEQRPTLDFLEVHSENFFHAGGAALATLQAVREHYPLSLHGVGLSLGSADDLRAAHLDKLARLVERVEPALVSEHLCWGAIDGQHLGDLLPMPNTREALDLMVQRVDALQSRLGRRVLIENISAYLRFKAQELNEFELLAELARRSGCGLLLDINNLYVNAQNFGFDPITELHRLDPASVGEIHLAGHSVCAEGLVDTHGTPVCEAVWALYGAALEYCGAVPTLIERDTDIPPLPELLNEAAHARAIMRAVHECEPAHA